MAEVSKKLDETSKKQGGIATKQAKKSSRFKDFDPTVNLPKERQFGQPNGNPRHNGAWRKEDTPRYKLELMIKMTEAELRDIADNKDVPFFERKLAFCISRADWSTLQGMINQVYGAPKQPVENIDKTPQAIKIEVLQPKKAKGKDDD